MKSDLAKARDNWFVSETGKSCCDGVTRGQYLKNRLEKAFIAGWEAHDLIDQQQDENKRNSQSGEPDPDVEVLEPREMTEGCDPPQTKDGNKD